MRSTTRARHATRRAKSWPRSRRNLGGNASISIESHPAVLQAQAALERAKLNLSYTVIRAPEDGIVAKVEQLQVGNYINASNAGVRADLDPGRLGRGQFQGEPAHLHAAGPGGHGQNRQLPGRGFQARVASLSPGTGSAFSLLPPENATGNWVKVVQRLPVRLAVHRRAGGACRCARD